MGPVVGRRADVELVGIEKRFAFAGQDPGRRLVQPRLLHLVVAVHGLRLHARIPGRVEPALPAKCLQLPDLSGRQGRFRNHQGARIPASDLRQVQPRFCDAQPFQGLDGRGEQLDAVPRRQLQPAGDRQDSAGLQPAQVVFERLHRVELALGQGVQARRRRAE